ncbi:DNA helicase RecG, partial [Patescibacteria group bacterium]|nr:DNA helicase RecG [Patescibacteria group bacterium]
MDLDSPIEKIFRLAERQKKALKNLGLKTVRDLLFYFPSRYENFSERKNIIDLQQGDKTTVYGKITDLKSERARFKKLHYTQAIISDFTGNIKAVWFRQPYLATILKIGDKVALTGKISLGKNGLYLANPTYERIGSYEDLGEGASLLAIYPETRGISSRWLRFSLDKILKNINEFPQDAIPEEILKTYHLPSLKSSLIFIHTPQKISDAEASRKRFAFEEIFFIQLSRFKERLQYKSHDSFAAEINDKELNDFMSIFPFQLTSAQKKSIGHIINDLQKTSPMSRLLEGDVGSGKTAVAVVATYAIVKNGWQVAYMAPTEILAQQ